MSYTRVDFDNPEVAAAASPSNFVYHHGPIPNHNPGWRPPLQRAAIISGEKPPPVTAADNANPPNAAVALSSVNFLVCDVDINGGQMCGMRFKGQPGLRRHIRNAHAGTITNRTTANTTWNEQVAAENALKSWVLSGGWRTAKYLYEPGHGSVNSLVWKYADACEEIARKDPTFAAAFGTHFHRVRRSSEHIHTQRRRRKG